MAHVWSQFSIVHISDDGRYEFSLPWVENKVGLLSNREGAERRLRFTTFNLRRDGTLNAFDKVFKEWLIDGIEEIRVSPDHYFLIVEYLKKIAPQKFVLYLIHPSRKPKRICL